MPFKYNIYTGKLDFYEDTTLPAVPEEQVFFSTDLPTDVGVVFTPDTPALENTLYISETTSQVYTYSAGVYSTYVSPIPNNTAWYITGTTIDAGGNKTATVERYADIKLISATNAVSFMATTGARGLYMRSYPTGSNYLYGYNADFVIGTSSVHPTSIATSNTIRIGISAAGVIRFNNAYSFPTTDGTANYFLKTNGSGTLSWGVAGLSYFTEAQTTAAPNATVNVASLTANTTSANGDLALLVKGYGAILANIPDNTTTGGNKRGQYSVDLQMYRDNANQVASGFQSTIGGGWNNRASGDQSVSVGGYRNHATSVQSSTLGGYQNTASGVYAVTVGGSTNTAFGNLSFACGNSNTSNGSGSVTFGGSNIANGTWSFAFGNANQVDGLYSQVRGLYGNDFGVYGRFIYSMNNTILGDSQSSKLILNKRTTDATATVLSVQGATVSATSQLVLSNNSVYRVKGSITGKQSASTNVGVWDVDCVIVRGVNASSTVIAGTPSISLIVNTGSFGIPTITANTTLGCLTVTVTGVAATNIQWTCVIDTCEVIYA